MGFYGEPGSVASRFVSRFPLLWASGLAEDLQDVVDKAFDGRPGSQGEIALEEDAVRAGEHGDDQAGKLGDEARQRLYGVLLRDGTASSLILMRERRFGSSLLVAALPR